MSCKVGLVPRRNSSGETLNKLDFQQNIGRVKKCVYISECLEPSSNQKTSMSNGLKACSSYVRTKLTELLPVATSTNNAVESWNRRMNYVFGRSNARIKRHAHVVKEEPENTTTYSSEWR